MASTLKLANETEMEIMNTWKLMSSKPNLIVCNVDVRGSGPSPVHPKFVADYFCAIFV